MPANEATIAATMSKTTGIALGAVPAMAASPASIILTGGSSLTAKTFSGSLLSGKILGLSLATLNPWILIGLGSVGGYYYCRNKRFRLF